MRSTFTLLVFVLSAVLGYGQEWQSGRGPLGIPTGTIVAHDFNPDILIVGNAYGRPPYYTLNGGETWTRMESMPREPTSAESTGSPPIEVLFEPGTSHTVLVVMRNLMFRTTDFGHSWSPHKTDPPAGFKTLWIHPVYHNLWYVNGEDNAPLTYSTDRGRTWSLSRTTTDSSYVIFASEVFFAASDPLRLYVHMSGELWVSYSGGRWFSKVASDRSIDKLLAVDHADPKRLYAGTHDAISTSSNGGLTWSTARFQQPTAITKIVQARSESGTLWAVGSSLYRSDDRGLTWSAVEIPRGRIYSLRISNDLPVLHLWNRGLYIGTMDGSHWKPIPNNFRFRSVSSLVAVSPVHWLAESDTEILQTTDAGESWQSICDVELDEESQILSLTFDVSRTDPRIMIRSTKNGISRTTDAGATWQRMAVPPSIYFTSISINQMDHCDVLALRSGELFRTKDCGALWEANNSITGSRIGFHRRNTSNGNQILAKSNNTFLYSDDGGTNWVDQGSSSEGLYCLESAMDVPKSYFMVNYRGFHITTDAGSSWSLKQASLSTARALAHSRREANELYAVSALGSLYRISTDTYKIDTLLDNERKQERFHAQGELIVAGSRILTTTSDGLMEFVSNTTSLPEQVDHTSSLEIEPQPASETISIRYPTITNATVTLYSVTGSNVLELHVEPSELSNGIILSTSHLTSGTYVMCIKDGKSIASRLVLITE